MEESNAKMLAGPGGCYAFYFNAESGDLTIGLHLLDKAPGAGAGEPTSAYHDELLRCPAASDAIKASAGEWGLQRCNVLREVRHCREALEALKEPADPDAADVAVEPSRAESVVSKMEAAWSGGAGQEVEAGKTSADGMDVDGKAVHVKVEKAEQVHVVSREGEEEGAEKGPASEMEEAKETHRAMVKGEVVLQDDINSGEQNVEEPETEAARALREEEEARLRQQRLELEREKEGQRRERQRQVASPSRLFLFPRLSHLITLTKDLLAASQQVTSSTSIALQPTADTIVSVC